MDSIEWLRIAHNYNVIMVAIDRFTKFGHFVPLSHLYIAAIVAILLMNNVFKLHGLPKSIVSNKNLVFVSSFWTSLFSL